MWSRTWYVFQDFIRLTARMNTNLQVYISEVKEQWKPWQQQYQHCGSFETARPCGPCHGRMSLEVKWNGMLHGCACDTNAECSDLLFVCKVAGASLINCDVCWPKNNVEVRANPFAMLTIHYALPHWPDICSRKCMYLRLTLHTGNRGSCTKLRRRQRDPTLSPEVHS